MTDRPESTATLSELRVLLDTDPSRVASMVRRRLKATPSDPALLRLSGAALRRLDRNRDAARAEAEAIAASMASPAHLDVARALAAGDNRRAGAILEGLVAADPDDVVALVKLGRLIFGAGGFADAEQLLRRAVMAAPDDPSARLALAEFYAGSKRPARALAELEQVNAATAKSPPAMALRAAIMSALGRHEEEVAILDALILAEPGTGDLRLRLGHALKTLGRAEDAVAAYRSMIALNPLDGTAWWSLANLKTTRFSDDDIARMTAALQANSPVRNRIRLNFALGQANEERGAAEAAFGHYAEGNRLRSTIANYDSARNRAWVEASIDTFTADFFARHGGQGATPRDPIFVIGMHRSGSTLVEQILASHPQIEGTAELTDITNIVRDLGDSASQRDMDFWHYLDTLDPDQLRALGQSYLETTRIHRELGRPLFIDKMPNNWLYVGLIRLILPNAKIVDVRRNPLACGFSNWKQLYAKGLEHSNSLETMGLFYADYVAMMRHFDAVQPGAIHRVIYENLVDDLDGEVRRLLAYLDVPFDPACLEFYANDRAVRTISANQVRQPINRAGIDQWRAYEAWLGPLKQSLGATLDQWRD